MVKYKLALASLMLTVVPVASASDALAYASSDYNEQIKTNRLDYVKVSAVTTPPTAGTTNANTETMNEVELANHLNILPVGSEFNHKNISYVVGNRVLTATKIQSFVPSDVIIPDSVGGFPVTKIQDSFLPNITINSLTVGDSVQTIGSNAFSGSKIKNLILGRSVLSIGDYAFEGNNLSNLVLPSSLVKLGVGAFQNGTITSVNLGIGLKEIPANAFKQNNLSSIIIPPTILSIGDSAFENNQISSLTLQKGLTSVGRVAFANNRLTEVYIPSTVNLLGDYAYYGNQIKKVTMPQKHSNYISQITTNVTALDSLVYFEDSKDPGYSSVSKTDSNTPLTSSENNVLGMAVKSGTFGMVRPDFTSNSFGTFELSKSELQKTLGFNSDLFVVDTSGTGKGWVLTLEASPFKQVVPSNGKPPKGGWLQLPKGSLSLTGVGNPYKINTDGTKTAVSNGDLNITSTDSVIDSGPIKIMQASPLKSFGAFGLDMKNAKLVLTLNPNTILVDSENYPNQPTPYTTTLTWTLTAGPGN